MKNLIPRALGAYFNLLAMVSPQKAREKSFALFCRPFRTRLTDKQKQFFATAENFEFDVEDKTIHGYKWGNGPRKILFLHGWQSHTYRWKAYIEALPKDQFTIYALDAPGHGQSSGNFLTVPVYSSVIREFVLNQGDFHAVVSHSLGGFSLLYTLYQFPLLPINRIILMAPPGEANDFVEVYRNTLRLSNRVIALISEKFEELYDTTPDFFSIKRFSGNLSVPGLIIHDEGDAEAPYHYAKSLSQVWKRSKLITTSGFGHNLKSPEVIDYVTSFIADEVKQPVAL